MYDAINLINDPAGDYNYHCPKHGAVDADHDIDYCLNGDYEYEED